MKPFAPRRNIRSTAAAALVGGACAFGCVKAAAEVPASAPATRPAATAPPGDWPAFHGGGELRGEAKAIAAKPLALRWTYKADENGPINASAAIVGGVAYVGDGKGRLHAVDLTTGKAKWVYKSEEGFETTPLVLGGNVMLGDLGGIFHCVSAETGKKVWTFDAESPIHSSANSFGSGAEAKVVFGDDGADVVCLKAVDGSKIWTQKSGDRVNGAPAVGFGAAFVSGCDAHLHAMKLEDGGEKFSADLESLCPGSPAILSDRIVVGTDGGRVVCFSPDGAKKLWEYEEIGDKAMVYASPAVAEGVAVVGARDRHVHGIDLETGKRKWDFATRGDVDSSPVISGGRVYVGSRDKKLYVLDLKTGENLQEFTAGRAVVAGPAVGEGVVVVGDTAGNLYCLEPR